MDDQAAHSPTEEQNVAASGEAEPEANPFLLTLRRLVNETYKEKLSKGETLTSEETQNTKLYFELTALQSLGGSSHLSVSRGSASRKRKDRSQARQAGHRARQRVLSRVTPEDVAAEFKGIDVLRRTYFQFISFAIHTFEVESVSKIVEQNVQ